MTIIYLVEHCIGTIDVYCLPDVLCLPDRDRYIGTVINKSSGKNIHWLPVLMLRRQLCEATALPKQHSRNAALLELVDAACGVRECLVYDKFGPVAEIMEGDSV